MDKYLAHFVTEIRDYLATMRVLAAELREPQTPAQAVRIAAQQLQRLAHTISGLSGSLSLDDFTWISDGLEACATGAASLLEDAQVIEASATLAGLLALMSAYMSTRVDALETAGTFQTEAGKDAGQLRALEETFWRLINQASHGEQNSEPATGTLSQEDEAILRAFAESELESAPQMGDASLPPAAQPSTSAASAEPAPGDDIPEEMRQLFQTETLEDLQLLQSTLAQLETNEDRAAAVLEMRRIAHKIKGAASTLNFQTLAGLAHCLEDLLDLWMNQRLAYSPAVLDALVHGVFEMEAALRRAVTDEPDSTEGLERLQRVCEQFRAEVTIPADDPEATHPDSRRLALAAHQTALFAPGESSILDAFTISAEGAQEHGSVSGEREQTLRVDVRKLDQIMGLISELATNRANNGQVRREISDVLSELRRSLTRMHDLVAQFDEETVKQLLAPRQFAADTIPATLFVEPAQTLAQAQQSTTQSHPRLAALRATPSHPHTQEQAPESSAEPQGAGARGSEAAESAATVVPASRFPQAPAAVSTTSHPFGVTLPSLEEQRARRDALGLENFDNEQRHLVRVMNESINDVSTVSETLQRLLLRLGELADAQEHLTGTIQRDITHLRLVPIRQILPRLQLTARMAAQEQGKQITFQTKGEATEIDRDIIEAISGPLAQLVRNCVAHGIEPAAERRAQGKEEAGIIWLHAYYSGNEVSIEVGDDGSGINYQGLVEAALAGGQLTPEKAETLTHEEAVNLMLLPNVSTSPEVTTIAGRGVGMDMVRSTVEGLKGTLHIHSQPGEGAIFHIRLPISLGVTRALFVRAGRQTYAVPLGAIERILKQEQDAESIQANIPTFRLTEMLGLAPSLIGSPEDEFLPTTSTLYVSSGQRQVGILIDEVLQEQEIVVKRLPTHLRRQGVRGSTLNSTGELILLLDLPELAHRALRELSTAARPTSISKSIRVASTGEARTAGQTKNEEVTVLVVDDSQAMRRTLEFQLTRAGYRVLAAKDGVDALEVITQKQRPNLVLLDIEMPRMDGYEVLSTLRSQRQYRALPIVMLTSRAAEKHRYHAMELGASAYLVKPCPHDELLYTIAKLTAQS
ncbi:MAG TPA: response regulator [Ktedonobacterales bacterium]|nr:response regulator [Ktedonobacterales bacterium]